MKAENERLLSLLIQENESQEALMVAKHEGEERAARKADQLQTERNASASNQPQIPECPVGVLKHLKAHTLLPQKIFLRILWLSCALSICHYKKKTNYIAKLCQSIFQRQIALYSPCWSSSSRFVTINSTSIEPSMKVRNLTSVHHIIPSASSVHHQCITSASSLHHHCIIGA